MAMRLYNHEEIVLYAKKNGLKFENKTDHHLIFSDTDGEPYSVPCSSHGCPDYLYDIFIEKLNKSDSKVVGKLKKTFDIVKSEN